MGKTETHSFELTLDLKSAVPIYEQIKNAVKFAIIGGLLADGEQLTSVRDLALKTGVNPLTILKAYNQLETDGFLVSRRGSGFFIRANHEVITAERRQAFHAEVATLLARAGKLGFSLADVLGELKKYGGEKR